MKKRSRKDAVHLLCDTIRFGLSLQEEFAETDAVESYAPWQAAIERRYLRKSVVGAAERLKVWAKLIESGGSLDSLLKSRYRGYPDWLWLHMQAIIDRFRFGEMLDEGTEAVVGRILLEIMTAEEWGGVSG